MSLIGYAQVSAADQDVVLQRAALVIAGIDRVFEDRGVPGAQAGRPGSSQALAFLRDGDTPVVWKRDRPGRSMTPLLRTVARLEGRGVGFRSPSRAIDTTTPPGRLISHIFGASGRFERDPVRERTGAGLRAAARGRKERRPIAATPEKVGRARMLIGGGLTVLEAAVRARVGKSARYAALSRAPVEAGPPE